MRRRSRAACARRPRRRSPIATRSCSSSTRAPGVTPSDRHFAQAVRRADKPIILLANKAEGTAAREGVNDAYQLGLGEPIPFSSEHGDGTGDLYDALRLALPVSARLDPDEDDEPAPLVLDDEEDGSEADPTKPLRIAVLGRPNAGKSTLLNRLLGEERLLTGPEPGLTRDSIGLNAHWRERKLKVFDTAGLRRKSRVVEKLEKLAVADALARGALRRGGDPVAGRDDPVREAGPDAGGLGRARGQGGRDRPQQMGPHSRQEPQGAAVARGGGPSAAAASRRARHSRFRPHRRPYRQADGSGDRDARDLESSHLDGPAQSLAGAGG